jgi:nucleoside-diphosphate-sugar epimerase
MRVLVAGATGVFGKSVLDHLAAAGHIPVEPTVPTTTRAAFLASLDGITADAVLNLLGTGTELVDGYRAMHPVNRARLEGTSTLIAAARRLGATRLVSASSFHGYGFDTLGDRPLAENAPFGESDDTENSAVQLALLGLEQQTRAFGGVVLRFAHLVAENADRVPAVPRVWTGTLPVVHVDDAARAVVRGLESGRPGGTYNIAGDELVSWKELQQAQSRVDGFAAPVIVPDALIRVLAPFASQIITRTSLRLSTAAARDELDWVAKPITFLAANTAATVGAPA